MCEDLDNLLKKPSVSFKEFIKIINHERISNYELRDNTPNFQYYEVGVLKGGYVFYHGVKVEK